MHRSSVRPLRILFVLVPVLVLSTLAGPARAFDGTWFDTRFQKDWILAESSTELLVQFEPAAAELDREILAREHRLTDRRPFDPVSATAVYRTAPGIDARDAARSLLSASSLVRAAVPAVVDAEGYTKYYIPGQLTVRFRDRVGPEDCVARIHGAGSSILQDHWTPGYYTITVPAGETVFSAIRAWYRDADVLFSEPSYMVYDDALDAREYIPNDPLFPQQWNLKNTGQSGGTPGADIDAVLAWEITKGNPNVIVCVIDTGMDLTHEDLAANLLPRGNDDWDFYDPGDNSPDDEGDHGTACSGIAIAVQDNGIGVSGIAPHCRIMPLRVNLNSGQNQSRADAINYAAGRRADFAGLVMSCSWRMSAGDFTAVHDAIVHADSMDCVMVFASGNSNGAINYPALYPETVACGASSPCDERKSLTSCDGENFWGSCFGPELDVIAPGVKITTTDRTGGAGYSATNYYNLFNGTSSATPLAAGTCALIWSINPTLSAHQVRAILEAEADDQVGPPSEDAPGWDQYFGWGRINAFRAVQAAAALTSFEDDMEAGGIGWNHEALGGGNEDAWHLSQMRNHTDGGTTSYKCGAADSSDYGTHIHAALLSPSILAGSSTSLLFWHWMGAFAVDDSTAGDGGMLEVTTNGGSSWTRVDPLLHGYTHVWRSFLPGPFRIGDPLWSGSFDWTQVVADLSAYDGRIIRFRYRFGTRGQQPTGEGWYVDDVEIRALDAAGAVETVRPFGDLVVEPNVPNPFRPVTALRYSLERSLAVHVDVADLSGRIIRTWDLGVQGPGGHSIVWDGRDGSGRSVASGVYFYRIAAGRIVQTGRMSLLK